MMSKFPAPTRLSGTRHPCDLSSVFTGERSLLRRFSQSPATPSVSFSGPTLSTERVPIVRNLSTTPIRLTQEASMPWPEPEEHRKIPKAQDEFWRRIPIWRDVSAEQFISWEWSRNNAVEYHARSKGGPLEELLTAILPSAVPTGEGAGEWQTRQEFIDDVIGGLKAATMSMRLMPYTFSRINWDDPRNDPIFRQFIPLKSLLQEDHPISRFDPLHEDADSPVEGLVHRYPDKALFLPISVCPTYCAFCTRSYSVGAATENYTKKTMKPILKRWHRCFDYLASQPGITDVVVSGGDAYYLTPDQLAYIGERLVAMPNIKKFRIASKGLAVCPNRILDPSDGWADALIHVSNLAKKAGKRMALHTHFNHPSEISWMTELASQRLFDAGVTVRNQTVLLRGINDNVQTMSTLIRTLAETLRIEPYYVYQCDMAPKAEHFRTPLQTILDLEAEIRGSIAGFDMPRFIVDLPGGGGKRDAWSFKSYDRTTGISRYVAPAVKGQSKDNKVYEYFDPMGSLVKNGPASIAGR
ncbi:hypothetical protein BJ170DRAFT_467974 [Xylariales sp. AK1849]|nr:hypothetical protein BJ170DRAFT_467974 [Xylariales sp. AK1849]